MPEETKDGCKNCRDCKDKDKAGKDARWREDFPVQWESDNYITRREMVKFLGLGSLTIAGANFVLVGLPQVLKAADYPRLLIGQAEDIRPGGSRLFQYPAQDDPCIMVRKQDGTLVAYSQVCTHLSCAVVHDAKDDALFCPCHNGYFTVEEGRPFAGPPTRPLPSIKLEERGNQIYAIGVEVQP